MTLTQRVLNNGRIVYCDETGKVVKKGDRIRPGAVKAAQEATNPEATRHECECGGSGKFYSGGMILNGVYTGTIGVCYRCGGKGYQTEADVKRNRYYDNHVRRIYA